MLDAPEDAAEEAKHAADIFFRQGEAAQEQSNVAAVCLAHGRGRIVASRHCPLDEASQQFEPAGSGGTHGARCGLFRGVLVRGQCSRGQLVEADSDGLAQVHGGLVGVGGDLDEEVAVGEVFAGEAVFFPTEDKGNAACAGEFALDDGSEIGEGYDGLLGLAMGEGSGAKDEGAAGDGLCEVLRTFCLLEQFERPDGGFRFQPIGCEGGDDGEMREAEVGHGAGGRADVERVARGDQDDFDAVALRRFEQGFILERERCGLLHCTHMLKR